MFAVGALDDLRDVSPPAKIAGMVLAGSLLSLFGVSMLFFRVPFAGRTRLVLSPDLAPLVTVIVGRGVRQRDQPDRRARRPRRGHRDHRRAPRCSSTPTGCSRTGSSRARNIAPLVAVIAVGICVGFLPYNFNPARIFMGDAGALFLGLLLAVTTITIGGRADYQYTGHHLLLLRAAVHPDRDPRGADRRHRVLASSGACVRGQSFAVADKDHLHHRLMRLGHGPRRTVVILWLWTALLSGLALLPTYTEQGNAQRAGADRRARPRAAALRLLRPGPARRPRPIAAEEEAEAGDDAEAEPRRGRRSREPPPRHRTSRRRRAPRRGTGSVGETEIQPASV